MTASYVSTRLSEICTLEEAWKSFVGGMTPREFLMYARSGDAKHAVSAYVEELPKAMGYDYTTEEFTVIQGMLLRYIQEAHDARPLRRWERAMLCAVPTHA